MEIEGGRGGRGRYPRYLRGLILTTNPCTLESFIFSGFERQHNVLFSRMSSFHRRVSGNSKLELNLVLSAYCVLYSQ